MDKPHYLELDGPARVRGRAHGEALRGVIREVIGRWQAALAATGRVSPPDYVAWLAGATGFEAAIRRWTPELLEEVRGIAEGAAIDYELVYAWQMLDEHYWLLRQFNAAGREHCSTLGLAARPGQPAVVAQNLDLPTIKDGAQTVLRIRYPDSGLEALVLTQAGALASLGMNHRPLGVCVNSLPQLDCTAAGLPVCFAIRGALERPGVAAAADFLRSIPHASGQNYVVGGPDGIVDLECSARGAVPFAPFSPERQDVFHTNHPLVNPDQAMYRKIVADGLKPSVSTTRARFDFLAERLADPALPRSADAAKRVLASPEVCMKRRPGVAAFTAACAVLELSADPAMHVTAGPPDEAAFHRFSFDAG